MSEPQPGRVRLPGGGMALIPADRDEVLLFNATAHHLWRVYQLLGRSRMAAALTARYGLPEDAARQDAEEIWATWQQLGLLQGPDRSEIKAHDFDCDLRSESSLDDICFQLGPIDVKVSYSPCFAGLVVPLFSDVLTARASAAAIDYRLEDAFGGCGHLCESGRVIARSAERRDLIGFLCIALLERLSPDSPLCAVMHGGAVAHEDDAVVLAGPSGSGKSTLTAYLAAHGFRGMCDDLLALRMDDLAVVPFPIAMKIKPGSVAALRSSYPHLKPETVSTQSISLPAEVFTTSRAAALIFPEYRADAAVQFSDLDVEEALESLLKDRLYLGSPIDRLKLSRLIDWLGRIERRRLVYSDLADAARCIRSILPA